MAMMTTNEEAGGLASLHDAIAASDAPGGAGSESAASKRTRGKPTHPVWQLFTAKPEAYKLTNGDTAECLHCHEVVRHHNKVLSVVRHLRKCRPFGAIVEKMDAADRPEWLAAGTKRARIKRELTDVDTTTTAKTITTTITTSTSNGVASDPVAAAPAVGAAHVPTAATEPMSRTNSTTSGTSSSSKSPIVKAPVHAKHAHLQSPALANDAAVKTLALAKASAIKTSAPSKNAHVQTSSTNSSAPVSAALKGERTGMAIKPQPPLLLSPQQPSVPVRTSYPIALRTSTAAASATSTSTDLAVYSSYTCVVALDDATTRTDARTVQYFATSAPTAIAGRATVSPPQLIDAVESLTSDAASIAQDLARVMHSLDTASLCGAVTSSNSLAHQQARAELRATHFRSRFFHGCATNGLEILIASVFGSSASGAGPSPPSRSAFLAGFTTDCARVVQCLTALLTDDSDALERDGSVAALCSDLAALRTANSSGSSSSRTLALCFTTLQRHATAVHSALVNASRSSAHADAHACVAVVESATFASTLETARAIAEPIATAAELFVSPRVVLSDAYHAFVVRLPDAFRAITTVSPIEAAALVRASETSFNAIAGDAHGLANVLDPRFLGDGMTREVQERVEDLLFSFPAHDNDDTAASDADDARQEAIYTQYTEFRVAALAERSKQSFRFQMLRKGRKSALQYWQSDATYWPELQQVALKVFSMATSTAPTAAAPGSSSSGRSNAVDVAA